MLNNGSFINYTQCMPEILQNLRVMRQDIAIPTVLEPYVFDKHLPPQNELRFPDMDTTDIFICEISTARNFSYQGVYFQINHMIRHLIEPHGALLKPWFAAASALNEAQREVELQTVLQAGHDLSDLEIDILKTLKVEQQSKDDLQRDIRVFRDMLPAPVLLVTHCDVLGDQGERIQSRVALIEQIADIAESEGIDLFQPSELIEKYGQSVAMAEGGKDSNHYNPDFYPTLAEHLFTNWISPDVPHSLLKTETT